LCLFQSQDSALLKKRLTFKALLKKKTNLKYVKKIFQLIFLVIAKNIFDIFFLAYFKACTPN
jgi:hypothetical protein